MAFEENGLSQTAHPINVAGTRHWLGENTVLIPELSLRNPLEP